MRLVMTMLVRNEEDIIRANIEFHRSMGVDFFLVMDHGSDDKTLTILDEFSRKGFLKVYHQANLGYYQSEWVSEMAREAYARHDADWIINNDADEFWWPSHGNLKESLSLVPDEIDGLYVKRYNFPPIKNEHSACFYDTMIYRDLLSVNSHGSPLPGKMCHRACSDVVVSQGNHDACGSTIHSKQESCLLEILHFPVRSLSQFTNKIRHGGMAYMNSPLLDERVGSTWRELFRVYQCCGLEDFYHKQCINVDQNSINSKDLGRWQMDDRLQRYMWMLTRKH